ncbi:MAG: alpha-galactosidase, partial [Clostridia bacterium]|nr:alpha-galactosidase [Clostridia bacterium]
AEADVTDRIFHTGSHVSLHKVRFFDRTDTVDALVREEDAVLYRTEEAFDGNLFFFTDPTVGEACMVQKEAPAAAAHLNRCAADMRASSAMFSVFGSGIDYLDLSPAGFTAGYPVTIALCAADDGAHTAREVYSADCGGFAPFIMSNTWGDRSQDSAVCEAFLKTEILRAAQIGVDIVQIDDGWQKGRSANSALSQGGVWNGGFYAADPDFWTPDPEKFPGGFGPLCRLAYEHGIALGLWFSPDACNDYANWKRDAEVLLGFYHTYGIRHFKLDGMHITSKTGEKNFLRMCFRVMMETEGREAFQMDITNDMRLGYFYEKDLGTLFVENRYTDWGNYFPHNTLRNLWQTSKYIPAQKLLFEVLNLHRNADKYRMADGTPDPLAPQGYDIDYCFASVMAANPLIWCEMQHLTEEDRASLHEIVSVYKRCRDDFIEVIPTGECPDGFSLTGFYIRGGEHDYYIGLRELSARDTVHIPVERILHTNDAELTTDGDLVRFSDTRKYFFAMLRKTVY